MVYHCFSNVGIWASLGKHENAYQRYPKSCEIMTRAEYEIVMRAEHEIGTKS